MEHKFLFLLGAGASVSSGLPTYRGKNGLYSNPEITELLTDKKIKETPKKVWHEINKIGKLIKDVKLGPTYKTLKRISDLSNSYFITQNVDGLIYKAGIPTEKVWELHGNLRTMTCMTCGFVQSIHFDNPKCKGNRFDADGQLSKMICGEYCRPDIVLFNETINNQSYMYALEWIKKYRPTHVIIVGTTLQFGYLQHIVHCANNEGAQIININPGQIELSKRHIVHYANDEGAQIINVNPGQAELLDKHIHYKMTSDIGLSYFEKTYLPNK